jgi:putative peptide zinc metalloprotease protein
MNIVHALDAALPEMPERVIRRDTPKLDPRVISKERMEDGIPVVMAKLPGTASVLTFTPEQWKLLQLFDGNAPYHEISRISAERTGTFFSEENIQEMASFLYEKTDFISKTPLEKNIFLKQQLRGQRRKHSKRLKIMDFTDITVKEWPNADAYISWLYPKLKFIFTPGFVLFSLFLFVVMLGMWADKFGEIWNDSFEFYNFTSKSGKDLIEFWFLFGAMACIHESSHGLACKHFGGGVEKMGFTLMYFAPSFFCDASQAWVYADRWQRIAVAIAGIWIDLIVCVFATFLWWGTTAGMTIHELAYKVMMVTGIGVSLLNLNPLIKLDGYLIFSDLIHEPDLKERSTAYLSSLTRKRIFGLPAEVEFVPQRRRAFYIIYAILSGMYGYLLLSFLMVLTYHILQAYTPEWAFVPALAIGYWVFKSKIKLLLRFIKMVYLDKKERAMAWLTVTRIVALTAASLLIVFLPLWPEFVEGRFVLEPVHKAWIRAQVAGRVTRVLAGEGQSVAAGQPLVELSNLQLASASARADADLRTASDQVSLALLRYGDLGPAEYKRKEMTEQSRALASQMALLQIDSPIRGVVVTPRLGDLLGAYLEPGAEIAEVADPTAMIARIYIPDFSMREIHLGTLVRLQPESQALPLTASLLSVAPRSTSIEPGLIPQDQLKGLAPPRFHIGSALLSNPGQQLREGVTGTAKIFVTRRSIAGFLYVFTQDLIDRKLW